MGERRGPVVITDTKEEYYKKKATCGWKYVTILKDEDYLCLKIYFENGYVIENDN